MNLTSKLRELICEGNSAEAVAFWTANRVFFEALKCAHDYPVKHRLFDLEVDGTGYRVLRCADCEERISIQECPGADDLMPGVPLELAGWRLRVWIEDAREGKCVRPVWADYLEPEPEEPRMW